VLIADVIQKNAKTVFHPKHDQIARGKNVVAGFISINAFFKQFGQLK
jgi:hypothetical protein